MRPTFKQGRIASLIGGRQHTVAAGPVVVLLDKRARPSNALRELSVSAHQPVACTYVFVANKNDAPVGVANHLVDGCQNKNRVSLTPIFE